MKKLAHRLCRFLVRQDGPTAVEYAIMLALVIVVCISLISQLGWNMYYTFYIVSWAAGS